MRGSLCARLGTLKDVKASIPVRRSDLATPSIPHQSTTTLPAFPCALATRRITSGRMFYRVDYRLALILAGAISAVLVARRSGRLEPSSLARGYFVVGAAITATAVAPQSTLQPRALSSATSAASCASLSVPSPAKRTLPSGP